MGNLSNLGGLDPDPKIPNWPKTTLERTKDERSRSDRTAGHNYFVAEKESDAEPSFDGTTALFTVFGWDLSRLARIFGADVDRRRAEDAELEFYRSCLSRWECDKLEVGAAEAGFLTIRMTYTPEGEDPSVYEHTYSGRYFVYWKDKDPKA
jgi:hypothetical protein